MSGGHSPTPTLPSFRDLESYVPRDYRIRRQDALPDSDYPTCEWVDAYVQSCYPTSSTTVYQNQWTRFIWNTRYTLFVGDNDDGQVTLILKNAETDVQVGNWTRLNKLGRFSIAIDDSWWDERAVSEWRGQSRNWYFYWQIIPSTHRIDGGEARQPTFTVVQTALPNSVISSSSASLISRSLASASSSIAAEESQSLQSAQQSRDAALQSSHDNEQFPAWAIALVVVLGVISLISILTLIFVLLRGARSRRARRRSSMGSRSPMMEAVREPLSPGTAGPNSPVVLPPPVRQAPSIRYDGASVTSGSHSPGGGADAAGVITSTDAAIISDAFRKALRKPDFADRPQEEGESPESQPNAPEDPLMKRELAEEGKNLRSVSSERGVKVVTDDDVPVR